MIDLHERDNLLIRHQRWYIPLLLLDNLHDYDCLTQSHTVDIPQSVKDSLKKFRFARRDAGSAALVFKVNKQELIVQEVEQYDDISIEDLVEGVSATASPVAPNL